MEDGEVQFGGHDDNLDSEESDESDSMVQDENDDAIAIGEMYELGEPRVRSIIRFGTIGYEADILLKNLERCENLADVLPKVFDDAINRLLPDTEDPTMMMGASLAHPELHTPILVPFRPRNMFNGETLISQIERIIQSNANISLEDQASKITLVTVKAPSGAGLHGKNRFYSGDEILNRKGVLKMKNSDDLCMARAIVLGRAMLHSNDPKYKWNSVRAGDLNRNQTQAREAEILMKKAGLEKHQGKCGFVELEKLQKILPDYQIKVFSMEHYYACTFEGMIIL